MSFEHSFVVDDQLGVLECQKPFSIAISTFSVDEHHKMHRAGIFHPYNNRPKKAILSYDENHSQISNLIIKNMNKIIY